jgi:NADH:ubiquinone oxidoreductase subunit C
MSENLRVAASAWVNNAKDLKAAGYLRCEWLTATHNGEDDFDITLCVSSEDLTKKTLVSSAITKSIETLCEVYPNVAFHEREVTQMFGVKFLGHETQLAFETQFDGFPLRRDFALSTRVHTDWPGAVEPEVSARRRTSLPPGVFETWKS